MQTLGKEKRNCPICNKEISISASVCPMCGSWVALDLQNEVNEAPVQREILSLEEHNQHSKRIVLSGVSVLLLLCVGVISGVWKFNNSNEQKFADQLTQEVIQANRTKTAAIVDVKNLRLTSVAAPTKSFMETQNQIAFERQSTQVAQRPEDWLDKSKNWNSVFIDDFSVEAHGWYTGTDDDELASGTWEIKDGFYRISLTSKDIFSQWMWPDFGDSLLEEFYLGVKLNFTQSMDEMDGGIIFRLQDDGEFYLFDLYANGEYAVYRHDSGSWTTLIDETPSGNRYYPGQPFLMELIGSGSEYYLYLNGYYLDRFEDDGLQGGNIGLLVGLPDVGLQGVWEFDDVSIKFP